jgi:hypothetical protein
LACRYHEEKQDSVLEVYFPFQQGKWTSVAFATKKIKKHFIGVIVSVPRGDPTVKFTRRLRTILCLFDHEQKPSAK